MSNTFSLIPTGRLKLQGPSLFEDKFTFTYIFFFFFFFVLPNVFLSEKGDIEPLK